MNLDPTSPLFVKIQEAMVDFQRWYIERYGVQAAFWWVKSHALWTEIQMGGIAAAQAWWDTVKASEIYPTNPGQRSRLEKWFTELVGII